LQTAGPLLKLKKHRRNRSKMMYIKRYTGPLCSPSSRVPSFAPAGHLAAMAKKNKKVGRGPTRLELLSEQQWIISVLGGFGKGVAAPSY
jgi:hypothetical protein